MADECPDFDQTLRTMLDTPPVVRKRTSATDEGDDQVEADEQPEEGDE